MADDGKPHYTIHDNMMLVNTAWTPASLYLIMNYDVNCNNNILYIHGKLVGTQVALLYSGFGG